MSSRRARASSVQTRAPSTSTAAPEPVLGPPGALARKPLTGGDTPSSSSVADGRLVADQALNLQVLKELLGNES